MLAPFRDEPATRAFESLRARWQNSTTGRRLALVVLLPLVLICLALGVALSDYATNDGRALSPVSTLYWNRFLLDWLWRRENFFSLSMGGVAAGLLTIGTAVFRQLLPQPTPRQFNTEEVAQLNQPATLLRLVEQSGQRGQAVVLVVDDVDLLATTDREFLAKVSRGALKRTRVLLITRDLGDTAGPVLGDTETVERLTVPAFSDIELRRIIANQKPHLAGPDLDAAVSEARGSLRRVLGADTEQGSLQRAVLAEFERAYDEELAGDFGLSHLMVYWAVKGDAFVTEQVLMDWIGTLDPEHLEAFELRPPERMRDLVKRFRRCRLVRRQGRTLHFDANACILLVRSLSQAGGGATGAVDGTRGLLAQAHCFWATRLSKGLHAPDGRVPLALRDGAQGVAAKEAAYHWSRLEPAAVASPAVHWRDPVGLCEEAACVLMLAAAALRSEGEFEAGKLASLDATKWAARLVRDRRNEVEAAVVGELWAVYLATWSPQTWQRLSILAKERLELTGGDVWVAYERYRAFLTGDPVGPPTSGQDTAPAWLVNLKRLGDVLLEARQREGFVRVALGDVAWALPEPASPPDATWPGLALCELHALAALERNDAEAEETALRRWRAHLEAAGVDPLWIAEQVSLGYHTTRYEHVVLSAARRFCPDGDPDWGRKWLALHAEPDDEDSGGAMNLFVRVRERYSKVSATAALLGTPAILAQVSFHLGELLLEHTPNTMRDANPEWWRGWENMFAACLRIERELGWRVHEPAIHKIRWEFFKADPPTSVNDAYNAYLAVRSSRFPARVVLDWHSRAKGILNDYGETPEHLQWSAELHEAWAGSLAALPEAEPYRHFKRSVPLERSRALLYAAQARRQANEGEAARLLLDEADRLCRCEGSRDPSGGDGEDPQHVRQHLLHLRLQRTWLQRALESRAPLFSVEDAEPSRRSDDLVLDLWRDLQRTDGIVALVLGDLVQMEVRQRHAADAWPPPGMASAAADPNNPRLSLPDDWFADAPVAIANRFEYRFLQLLSLLNTRRHGDAAVPDADALALQLFSLMNTRRDGNAAVPDADALALQFLSFMNTRPDSGYISLSLQLAGMLRWYGINRFGQITLGLASTDLESHFLDNHRRAMIRLLEAVRHYFAKIDPADKHELEALLYLAIYTPTSREYQEDYAELLVRHEALLQRELGLRSADPQHWLETATRFKYYFSVLVNSDLLANQVAETITRSGHSVDEHASLQKALRIALAEAKEREAAGAFEEAMTVLRPHLHGLAYGWVTIEDVEAVDLWLRCSDRVPAAPAGEVQRWSQELPRVARAFVAQFGSTISEPRVQQLTEELLKLFR